MNKKESSEGITRLKPGLSDYLSGDSRSFVDTLTPYLPTEIVGGSVPYIAGYEDETVWNAASQACSTERVSYVYSVSDEKIWYLACPSSAFASNPDSWCPLAAALPGNSEHWDKETVYIYEQDGTASALRWDPETGRMQVFIGASRTLLPKIQSMEAANFVNLDSENVEPIPWKSKALRTEKLSRATSVTLLLSGLFITALCCLIIFVQYMAIAMMDRDLTKVERDTVNASQQLMIEASKSMQSDGQQHMIRIQELLDELVAVRGTLVKYEVENGKVVWEALVPNVFANDTLAGTRIQIVGSEPDGRARIRGNK